MTSAFTTCRRDIQVMGARPAPIGCLFVLAAFAMLLMARFLVSADATPGRPS